MKKLYIHLLAGAAILPAVSLTGCIEEVLPTDRVTQEQVMESPKAASSYANGMPALMNSINFIGYASQQQYRHYDMGYPGMMHIRDVMTGDMPIAYSKSGYDWYTAWSNNQNQAMDNIYPQTIWNTYTQLVQTTNLTIGAIDPETELEINRYYLGAAYAFRAHHYLDMARMFEYLPCDATDDENEFGNNVVGLTVPIVTEEIDEAKARNNPRATHAEMLEFILSDLDKAEKYITATARPAKNMPDIACVYGLRARAYMWDQDYANARIWARKAIDTHGAGTVTTREQWLSPTTAFNSLATPSWMWGLQYTAEDPAVLTALINWISWVCNETDFGYASAEPFVLIDAALYNQIKDTDFRKLTFVAPKGSALSGQENWVSTASQGLGLSPLASLKIKPGQGNMVLNTVACVVGVPLMRVEEMYFIEAEAAAHLNPAEGKTLIENFMTQWRDETYKVSEVSNIVDEIFLQKRIEFFCEGQILFDYKRLNKPVTRFYKGTNWPDERQFNTTTRPAWMNFVIVQTEQNNNNALVGYNNPNPSDVYVSLGVPSGK